MNSKEIREKFLNYFKSKSHTIVPSAPMVVKNDPTLMFTNAGMNQFKDFFLGNSIPKATRVADSQKCLRVSGKHNDLEEVGHDTYHHTMFEMLGNWSFGDYFKKEAIDWAWELLTDIYKIPKDRLYATVFAGSKDDNLEFDTESKNLWKQHLSEDRILDGSKKDNFWEMGESGPCGPCSEIHVDLRNEAEREKQNGAELVNQDHPLVIEIWNLVFIQYNRKANGDLVELPQKHVDTGMGLERLCMVIQQQKSNYDTDIFQLMIQKVAEISHKKYGENKEADVAMRVISDHIRAICFSIADGQLPYREGAGYVIRRILRRAVRYGYTFLNLTEPFLYQLVPTLIEVMAEQFNELIAQKELIEKVILEEEKSFLRTLETGLKRLEQIITKTKNDNYKVINGKLAFELYDTYGFPLDLTELICKENGLIVSKKEYDEEMNAQKVRARNAASVQTDDWIVLYEDDIEEFIGYDYLEAEVKITRYRKVKTKSKEHFQLIFNITPFYAESGGQVGDKGYIESENKKTRILDTKKENNLIIHIVDKLPENLTDTFHAVVDKKAREQTECNHSATHLLHFGLRKVLGEQVEQKGSLVEAGRLRFDFSYYEKLTDEQIADVERIVNKKIRQNIILDEKRDVPMQQADKMGAIMLFGEKYGDLVRVIKFDDSVELCGGTHVEATGKIGMLKIVSESAIAAGIRRIEAVTSDTAEEFLRKELHVLKSVKSMLKNPKNPVKNIENLLNENAKLQKQIDDFKKEKTKSLSLALLDKISSNGDLNVLIEKINADSAAVVKDIAFQIRNKVDNLFLCLGAEIKGKASLTVMLSENLLAQKQLNANTIIKEIAKEIQGGGGGQAFYAQAGGKNPQGIEKALEKAKKFIV